MIMELQTRGRIVVGTDGSERAYRAVQWAADRVGKRNLPLLILHIVPENQAVGTLPAAAYGELASTIVAEYQTEFVEQARLRLDQLADREPTIPAWSSSPRWSRVVRRRCCRGVPGRRTGRGGRPRRHCAACCQVAGRGLGRWRTTPTARSRSSRRGAREPDRPGRGGCRRLAAGPAAVELAFQAAEVRGVPVLAVHAYTVAARHTVWEAAAWEPSLVEVDTSLATQMVEGVLSDAIRQHPGAVRVRLAQGRPQDAGRGLGWRRAGRGRVSRSGRVPRATVGLDKQARVA